MVNKIQIGDAYIFEEEWIWIGKKPKKGEVIDLE